MGKNGSFPGRPRRCTVVPKKRGGACGKRRKNGASLCKSCTVWKNTK